MGRCPCRPCLSVGAVDLRHVPSRSDAPHGSRGHRTAHHSQACVPLCFLSFVITMTAFADIPSHRSDLKAVLSAIRRRMRSRQQLSTQLDVLGKFQLPGTSPSPNCRVTLAAWRRSNPAEFEAAQLNNTPIAPPAFVRSAFSLCFCL